MYPFLFGLVSPECMPVEARKPFFDRVVCGLLHAGLVGRRSVFVVILAAVARGVLGEYLVTFGLGWWAAALVVFAAGFGQGFAYGTVDAALEFLVCSTTVAADVFKEHLPQRF